MTVRRNKWIERFYLCGVMGGALGVGACATHPQPSTKQEPSIVAVKAVIPDAPVDFDVLTMSRDIWPHQRYCATYCRETAYQVTVYRDGRVVYLGGTNAATTGVRMGRIAPKDVLWLAQALGRVRFMSMPSSPSDALAQRESKRAQQEPSARVHLNVQQGTIQHRVHFYGAYDVAPSFAAAYCLAESVDVLTGVQRWHQASLRPDYIQ